MARQEGDPRLRLVYDESWRAVEEQQTALAEIARAQGIWSPRPRS